MAQQIKTKLDNADRFAVRKADTSNRERFFIKKAENCLRFFVLAHLTRLLCDVATPKSGCGHGVCQRGKVEE